MSTIIMHFAWKATKQQNDTKDIRQGATNKTLLKYNIVENQLLSVRGVSGKYNTIQYKRN